jgi:hypothetical protein
VRFREETKERSGGIRCDNTRTAPRKIRFQRFFKRAPADVVSSDEHVLSIDLNHIVGRSSCADDAVLDQENAVAEAAQ